MKNKQILGLIAAALVFVFVGVSNAITKSKFTNDTTEKENKLTSLLESELNSSITLPEYNYVGVVEVNGTISESESSSIFSSESYNHQVTLDYIESMKNSPYNKGILLVVDSPGGGVYESDELYLKLKDYKETTGNPVWTYMKSQACSGGYYISMASDKIFANRNCTTGSIGVIMSLINTKDLYDKLGIKEINITSGKNKAMGSSGQDLTDEQKEILQSNVDEAYEQFVSIVADGRKMDVETVKKIADGRIYTAKQALELGLIDEIADYKAVETSITDSLGEDVELYTPDTSTSDFFSSLFSAYKGTKEKSDAQVITEYLEKAENRGLMYYAE